MKSLLGFDVVWFDDAVNEKAQFSVISKKKLEGDVGPGPMGLGWNM